MAEGRAQGHAVSHKSPSWERSTGVETHPGWDREGREKPQRTLLRPIRKPLGSAEGRQDDRAVLRPCKVTCWPPVVPQFKCSNLSAAVMCSIQYGTAPA